MGLKIGEAKKWRLRVILGGDQIKYWDLNFSLERKFWTSLFSLKS